jgi:hypothetical protein
MQQLLGEENTFTPEKVAAVLRNRDGINNKQIGLGNEKGVNQLIAHHAIIFKPEDRLVWVSSNPYQLGEFICYDLKKVFAETNVISNKDLNIEETSKTIPADPFLYSNEYKNFVLFKQLRSYVDYCGTSRHNLVVEPRLIEAFIKSNPESYLTYWTIGNYYRGKKENENALHYYSLALDKEVATEKERREITASLNKIKADDGK